MGYVKIEFYHGKTYVHEYTSDFIPPKKRRNASYKRDPRRKDLIHYKSDYSMHRAKTAFFKLVGSNLEKKGPPTLCTFTVYDGDQYFSDIYKAISKWKRTLERKTHQSISYIGVPEKGSRTHRVHVHALVWGLTGQQVREERSTRNLQRAYAKGFLDVRGAYDSSPKLASYLAKYLTKGNGHLKYGERAYTCGGDIERPRTLSGNEIIDHVDIDTSTLLTAEQFDTKYLGLCTLSVYKTNTNEG